MPERLGINAEELAQRLSSKPFVPCRPAQPLSTGWVPALADAAESLVHAAGPYILGCDDPPLHHAELSWKMAINPL